MFDTTISCLNRAEIKAIVKTTLTMTQLISQPDDEGPSLQRAFPSRAAEAYRPGAAGQFYLRANGGQTTAFRGLGATVIHRAPSKDASQVEYWFEY
jgi:hypothetical protein